MRLVLPLTLVGLSLIAGGAWAKPAAACPRGLKPAVTAELFFGRDLPGGGEVSDADWRGFLDAEVTPRFPDGLSVGDVYGQWRSPQGAFVREESKAAFIVLTGAKGEQARLAAIRSAYERRFRQQSVLVVEERACIAF